MKLALRYIPTEVWVDVFRYPWITRKQLGKIVHRFKNRKFAEFLQFYLHEWGKRTLGTLELDPMFLLHIQQTQMPENIKFIKLISIKHFDKQTLDFLRQINTLFITHDVNLNLYRGFEWTDTTPLRTVLDHLCPLLNGIHSLTFDQNVIPLVEQYFAQKLAQIKIITFKINGRYPQATINFVLNWLTSVERDSSEPRLLEVLADRKSFQRIYTTVRQQFLSAKRPCTFAVRFIDDLGWDYRDYSHVADFQMENNLGEQLHGQFGEDGYIQIHRLRGDFASSKLFEWLEEAVDKRDKFSGIGFSRMFSIGIAPIDANAVGKEKAHQLSISEEVEELMRMLAQMRNEVNDAEGEEDQPSTSKKQ